RPRIREGLRKGPPNARRPPSHRKSAGRVGGLADVILSKTGFPWWKPRAVQGSLYPLDIRTYRPLLTCHPTPPPATKSQRRVTAAATEPKTAAFMGASRQYIDRGEGSIVIFTKYMGQSASISCGLRFHVCGAKKAKIATR